MTEKIMLSCDMASEYRLGTFRANGKDVHETCWLESRGGGWVISINEHYLIDEPNERYARIYGTPCFVYKFGTQFDSRDSAIECFNQWLEVGRTSEEETDAMRPEWEEFARRNKDIQVSSVMERRNMGMHE